MMDHKAYMFNFKGFRNELAVILQVALSMKKRDGLVSFIEENIGAIKNPYTGEILQPDWEQELETGPIQELGDFALTKFYDPQENRGLGEIWITLDKIPKKIMEAFLGKYFGQDSNPFDPGKMGSYFQVEKKVQRNYKMLTEYLATCKLDADVISGMQSFADLLSDAAKADMGIYVTF